MKAALQLILSGVLLGGVYGLIAMGFVITYRSAGVFNIAYGQFAVMGAFAAWVFLGSPAARRLPYFPGLLLTFVAAVVFALLLERLVFRRMIGKPVVASFMLTLGLLALLHSVVMLVWGAKTTALASPIPQGPFRIGALVLSKEYLLSFVLALILAAGLWVFFRYTRLGLAMRAAYEDQIAARCLGVKAKRIAQLAWVLSTVIATAGGIIIASVIGVSLLLSELVMVVLAVVLIGGLDSLFGCLVGGMILAVSQNLLSYYVNPHLPGVDGIVSMVLILLILLIRPSGLFGTKPIERV
jgi:branched-chain amino acid transport system permease protein